MTRKGLPPPEFFERFGTEDGLERPPAHVSELRDMRFETAKRPEEIKALAPRMSAAEKAELRRAQAAARRDPALDKFCCTACGAQVVRPPDVPPAKWEQRRRCDACIAANRQPPAGKRHCRKCGKIFQRPMAARHGSKRPVLSCTRFCPRCGRKRK